MSTRGGDADAVFTVEVKHGKDKLVVHASSGDATVEWLMETLEEATGVLRAHQKLICKGRVLEAKGTIAEQAGKGGVLAPGAKVTAMLMASAGGGGAAAPPRTAGESALAASRAAKAAKLADAKRRNGAPTFEDGRGEKAASASRRAAWEKTGIVGLRSAGVDEIPHDVWTLGGASTIPSERVSRSVQPTRE